MQIPAEYETLSAFQRQESVDHMRAEVSELQAALDELNSALPKLAVSQYSRSLLPAPSNLGLKVQKTLKVSKSKVLGLEKFGIGATGFSDPGFITITQDGVALLWDAASGLKFEALRVGKGNMMSVGVNSSCRVAAAGGLSCAIDLYSVGDRLRDLTGESMKGFNFPTGLNQSESDKTHPEQFRLTLSGHDAAISSMQFLTDNLLVSGSQDGGVHIWDISTGTSLSSSLDCGGVVFISRGSANVFCTAATDGKLKIWDVRTRASEARWFGLPRPLTGAVYMPECNSVLLSDEAGMSLFDLRTGTTLEKYNLGSTLVTSYDVSPSGRFAFVGTDAGITVPVDLLHNRVLQPLDTNRGVTSSVRIIGSAVYASNWDGSVRIYAATQETKQ